MAAVGFIKSTLDFVHRALIDARNGTDEQLHFIPEHGAHSIAWCLWHTSRIEDLMIHSHIQKATQVWNEDWAERVGLPAKGFGTNMADEDAHAIHIKDMKAFAGYQDAVFAATAKFLDGLTDADLERELPTRDGTETVGQAISLHMLGHFNGHRGEINLLRGMQGMPALLQKEGTH
jgi:DinB superfamily